MVFSCGTDQVWFTWACLMCACVKCATFFGSRFYHIIPCAYGFLDVFFVILSSHDTHFFLVKQIYGSSVNGPVRHKCLSVIGKLMYFSTADMIQSLLSSTNISR